MSTEIKKKGFPFKFLGFAFTFQAPASVDDVERLVGEKGAVLAGFMQQYCFHDRGPEAKKRFARKLETFLEAKGIDEVQAFKMVDSRKAGADPVKTFTESEKGFFDRVFAAGHISREEAAVLANEVNEELGEWSAADVSTRKPGEVYYVTAREAMAKADADPSLKDKLVANIEKTLHAPFSDTFGEFNLDNLARAIKAMDDRKKAEAAAATRSALFGDDESGEEEESGE